MSLNEAVDAGRPLLGLPHENSAAGAGNGGVGSGGGTGAWACSSPPAADSTYSAMRSAICWMCAQGCKSNAVKALRAA